MASVIHSDPDILGGTPVFRGTRVPVESLFDHLTEGVSLDEFLDDFPTVSREQAIEVLRYEEKIHLIGEAAHDPLFLADMNEINSDFQHIDREVWEK